MIFVAHRINKLDEIVSLPPEVGVEFDVRDNNGNIVVEHDPFIGSLLLDTYLAAIGKRFLIVNSKSEGIEWKVLELLKKHGHTNYCFLDCSFPMIYKLSQLGESRVAIRFSEYESLESVLFMKGRVKWVWVDCFTRFPLTKEIETRLHENGFSLCMVSPELQGQADKRNEYLKYIEEKGIQIDAICSKLHYYLP